MRKYYLFGLIFSLVTAVLAIKAEAQPQELILSENIAWQSPRYVSPGYALLMFDGAVNHDSLGLLPVYQYTIPGSYRGNVSGYEITYSKYEPLVIPADAQFPDMDLISSEPRVIISLSQSRGIIQREINLLPLRINKDGKGYEKLVSFSMTLHFSDEKISSGRRELTSRVYATHSVLHEGDWYKIAVTDNGIYRITYDDLVTMGINPDAIDPRNIQLYGNGNGMLEEANSQPRPDDLMENAIFVSGESDGKFDKQDYILFYGESPVVIDYNKFYSQYEHEINFYTDKTYYFLHIGSTQGKRVQQSMVTGEPTAEVYTFQDLAYHETDEVNVINSGKLWFGETFNSQLEYTIPFDLQDIDLTQPVYLKASLAGRSTTKTVFNLYADRVLITDLNVPSIVLGSQTYARQIISNYEPFYASDEHVDLGITFEKHGINDIAWLDYLELNYIRHLKFNGGQMNFRDMRPVGPENIARYHIQTSVQGITVWDVTDPGKIENMTVSAEQGGFITKAPADDLREFIAFDDSQYYKAEFIEKVPNQDLHAVNNVAFVIITDPIFMDQANRLADYHRQYDGLSTYVTTPQEVYNEFSSGAQDICAIRDFMKMLYDRSASGSKPRYLLLFGDASYDYKNHLNEDNNLVPAYESRESLKYNASFVTDDFFGCLDDDEGSNGSGTMDIGVGRFPVNSPEQAEQAVTKTIGYMEPSRENLGKWRNSLCFIGDDEDNNTHLGQAEGLAEIVEDEGPVFNIDKIYLDAYQQLSTPSGSRYPDVNVAINKTVENGCLIINYTGHGGEVAWATERVLDIPAIQSYRNIHNMPAFLTATCEFSRYDDPGLVSAGELVFLNPDGAGIGLFTTTRLAFSQSNYSMNKRFYYKAFEPDSVTGEYPRMGDLLREAKTPSNTNIKNFVLLGDPALMLAYPKMKVRTLQVTNEGSGMRTDTIHALSRVTIEGQVEDKQGNLLENFDGILYPTVYDKPVLYKTRGNDPGSKVTDFYIQNKIIYQGEATITGGNFSFSFVVPVDISYQIGEGKISYYAMDTVNFIDANGYDPIYIGGSDELAISDEKGPDIELYLNTMNFTSGDITSADPLLIANLYDESGINTMGNGIGHDITAIIDNNYQEPILLNDYYQPETDSYQRGQVLYRLGPFSNGTHTLTLKAWDVLNNSSEKTVEFSVDAGARLFISRVGNKPNPFDENTSFFFEHNKPGSSFKVTVYIYSLSGQLVTTLHYNISSESKESGDMEWNGRDASGNEIPVGFYIYRLIAESDDGYISSISQKLLHFKY